MSTANCSRFPVKQALRDREDFPGPSEVFRARAWRDRWREGVLFGIGSQIVHAFSSLYWVAPLLFLRAPQGFGGFAIGHIIEAGIACGIVVILSRRYVVVRSGLLGRNPAASRRERGR